MRLVNAEGWPSESVGAMERRPSHALVTGGGGFLGRYIVEQLVARGDRVTTFSRGSYPELAALGARQVRGDLRDLRAITAACRGGDGSPVDVTDKPPVDVIDRPPVDVIDGPPVDVIDRPPVDVVYHVAARAGLWGPYDDFYEANVTGTDNVIEACRATGVRKLVYTSSPSVIFDGTDQRNVDESMPYPNHYESPYPETKAIGEQRGPRRELLGASNHLCARTSSSGHATTTCCFAGSRAPGARAPSGRWDKHGRPYLRRGRRSGPPAGGGCARARLPCCRQGVEPSVRASPSLCPGSATFLPGWACRQIRNQDSARPCTRHRRAARGDLPEPAPSRRAALTPFLASELAQDHYYDISRARRDFGYCPRFTMAQATERTLAALTETR